MGELREGRRRRSRDAADRTVGQGVLQHKGRTAQWTHRVAQQRVLQALPAKVVLAARCDQWVLQQLEEVVALREEGLRRGDELIIYDLVAEVQDASTRGEVFIFFSHQWLGWSEPDPKRIHVKAMQQAVRAVSADTDTPLEKIRVWVDYVSIPQKNLRERALAIASLPTFASVSD